MIITIYCIIEKQEFVHTYNTQNPVVYVYVYKNSHSRSFWGHKIYEHNFIIFTDHRKISKTIYFIYYNISTRFFFSSIPVFRNNRRSWLTRFVSGNNYYYYISNNIVLDYRFSQIMHFKQQWHFQKPTRNAYGIDGEDEDDDAVDASMGTVVDEDEVYGNPSTVSRRYFTVQPKQWSTSYVPNRQHYVSIIIIRIH